MQAQFHLKSKSGKQRREPKNKKLPAKELLANPEVKRWFDNTARGSELTAKTNLKRLDHFCDIHQTRPIEYAELALRDLRAATDLLQDHVTWMEEYDPAREKHPEPYAPKYINVTIEAVKSWLRHFELRINRKINIKNLTLTPTLEGEGVPNAVELSEILSRASLRNGAIISLMAKAGLRPQVLGNYNATDGLTMKDLPDIAIHQGVATLLRTPCMIIVRKTISKAKQQYFTFLTSQGTKRLLAYLNDRLARGEALTADTAVIGPDLKYDTYRGNNAGKAFLTTEQICRQVRKTFRPRFKWRPYILRSFFAMQLLTSEAKRKMVHDFRVFFMGHKGSIEATYTTNKAILPQDLHNEMRAAFKRSEELLDLEIKEEDPLLKQKEDLHAAIEKATPEKVQEILAMLGSAISDSESSNKRRGRRSDIKRMDIHRRNAKQQGCLTETNQQNRINDAYVDANNNTLPTHCQLEGKSLPAHTNYRLSS